MLLKTPRTEKQIEAARINGAKSRGPVTPEGKLNSAASRIASGSLAKTILLEGESVDRFNALLDSLVVELNPQTEIETTLVESLAVARWRQRRIQGMEKVAILAEASKQIEAIGPAERTTRAWQSLAEDAPWVDRMRLHEARYARQYFRALREFRDYRAARTAQENVSEGFEPNN